MLDDLFSFNPVPVNPTKDIDVEKALALPEDEDGIRPFIAKEELVGDIISKYPDVAMVLINCGMHCITCGAALYESLEEACYVHGLDPDDVTKDVNDYLTESLKEILKEQEEKKALDEKKEEKQDEKKDV